MAQVFDTNAAMMPSTPSKGDTTLRNPDAVPDYSPGAAPQYAAHDTTKAPLFEALARKKEPEFSIMPVKQHHSHDHHNHPVLPIGNVFQDIRHHLQCHSLFNKNIEILLSQFMTMKHDLDAANTDLAKARRETQRERQEKEGYKRECETLKTSLEESQAELSQTRANLVASEERLRLAIVQLDQAAQRLERLRNELRVVTRERDELGRKLADKERELEFYMARAIELSNALDVANAGENAANDRNARLTHLLYQIEDSKAHIERKKDRAEAHVRELEDAIRHLRKELELGGGRGKDIIDRLRQEKRVLELEVKKLTSERDAAQRKLVDRDGQIQRLQSDINGHHRLIDNLNGQIQSWIDFVRRYDDIIKDLPHQHRRKFKNEVRILRGENRAHILSLEDEDEDEDEDVMNTTMGTKPSETEAYSTGFQGPAEGETALTAEQIAPKAADKVEQSSLPNGNETSVQTTAAEEAKKEETKTE